jgi:hypothetical protein
VDVGLVGVVDVTGAWVLEEEEVVEEVVLEVVRVEVVEVLDDSTAVF